MIAYEFYLWDIKGGYKLLGVLPERRKKSERITRKSVMGWAEKVFSNLDAKNISFVQISLNEYTEEIPINSGFIEPTMDC